MTVSALMNYKPQVIRHSDTLESVVKLFQTTPVSGFVVVNDEQKVVGTITPKDLFTKDQTHIPTYLQMLKESTFEKNSDKELPYAASQLINAKVEDVMNQSVYFANPTTPIEIVAALWAEGKQTVVPVVEADNKFVGVILPEQLHAYTANGNLAPQIIDRHIVRPVDKELGYVRKDITSRFSFIARSKAHLWFSATMVLFIIGFILGIIFIVDPQPIANLLRGNLDQLLDSLFQ